MDNAIVNGLMKGEIQIDWIRRGAGCLERNAKVLCAEFDIFAVECFDRAVGVQVDGGIEDATAIMVAVRGHVSSATGKAKS